MSALPKNTLRVLYSGHVRIPIGTIPRITRYKRTESSQCRDKTISRPATRQERDIRNKINTLHLAAITNKLKSEKSSIYTFRHSSNLSIMDTPASTLGAKARRRQSVSTFDIMIPKNPKIRVPLLRKKVALSGT